MSTAEEWQTLLTQNPKMLWGVVADIVKAVKAGEGERKTGRRPAVSVGSLDELYTVLFPVAYSGQPFPQALATALGERSQRTFAAEAGFNQATVSRLLSGKSAPTVEMIERVAHTLNVPPTYFVEYRALKLSQVLTAALLANPQLSANLVRHMAGVPA